MTIPAMTDRQRFLATMHYQPRDRAPICDFSFWPETIDLWKQQGLPDWVGRNYDAATQNKFFGMDTYTGGPSANLGMFPCFEQVLIEDLGSEQIIRDGVGVVQRISKAFSSIPLYLDYTLKDRQTWEKEFKWRFDPSRPERYPNWDQARQAWSDPNYPVPRHCNGGSFYGWIRDWMGVENASLLVYDDPACFEDMVVTMTDCKVEVIKQQYAHGAQFDCCAMWEDMCYNAGPLLSPTHFKQYLSPQIKRVTEILRGHGCDIIWVDCDGKIDDLIPLWLEVGVNCMFPIEIGTWGADPVKYRKQYGKELLIMGGFDKHLLAQDKRAVEKEVYRLAPLVEEGGFIPLPDHRVPPDVPLENYIHYLQLARKVWGKNLNLKPLGELVTPQK